MTKELKTQVVYEGNEYMMTIIPQQCTFESLVNDVKRLINVDDNIQLMSVNTKESYQILSKNSLGKILCEELDDDMLILYCVISKEDNEINNDSFENELQSEKKDNDEIQLNNKDDEDIILFNDNQLIIQEQKVEEEPMIQVFNNEYCSLCDQKLKANKFICCICDNCIMCNHCESKHGHPSFKFKTDFLSDISSIYSYLKAHDDLITPQSNSEPTKKEYDITISPKEIEFTMRPKQSYTFPLTITNHSKNDIDSLQYTILMKNNTNTLFSYEEASLNIPKKSSSKIIVTCDSQYKILKDDITIELISNKIKFKDHKDIRCSLTIDVNDDLEEEELNTIFSYNDELRILPKSKKETLHYIIIEGLSKKSPEEIVRILSKHNWKLTDAVTQLL